MPNQRRPDKKMIGWYATPEERAHVRGLAAKFRTTQANVLRILIYKESDPSKLTKLLN